MKSRPRQLTVERLEHRHLLTTLVDLDADGDLDVLTERGWHENVDTYGNFMPHEFPYSRLASAGDLDGDGDLDIAAFNGWRENINGQGGFGTLHPLPVPVGMVVKHLKLTDVGADGDLDIILYNDERVLHFDRVAGRGVFELVDEFQLPNLRDVGDVDHDGRVDAVKLENRGIWVHYNRGSGQLQPVLWHQDVDPAPGHVAGKTFLVEFVDLNTDGWLDVAGVKDDESDILSLYVRMNDQSGNAAGLQPVATFCDTCRSQFDDFDMDGDSDLLINELSAFLWLIQNDGTGNFDLIRRYSILDPLDVGDINGDGQVDVLLSAHEWIDGLTGEPHVPGTTIELPDAAPFSFTARPIGEVDYIQVSAVADLSGNGTADLIIADWSSIEVWENGQEPQVIKAPNDQSSIEAIEAADLDGDGDIDVVFEDRNSLFWIENLGETNFSAPRLIAQRGRFAGIHYWALGDLNQDGLIDAVTATRGAGRGSTFSAHINMGDSFRSVAMPSRGHTVQAMTVADVDGDGDVDVFAQIRPNQRYENVWFENVTGQLQGEVSIGRTSRGVSSFHSADLNSDGRDDLIINTFRGIAWLDGFSGSQRPITDEPHTISLADIDDDGDTDVVGHIGDHLVWYANENGDGMFSDRRTAGIALMSTVHVADYTGTGRAQVITTDYRTGKVTLFEKRVTGDSNRDGVFNSSDLVRVFQQGEYEDGILRNSTFETGDWNGDGEFDSRDIVFAFQGGSFTT